MDGYVTTSHWLPGGRQQSSGSDLCALGYSDGSLKLMNKSAKIEKSVVRDAKDGHIGAVTCVRWNHEGALRSTDRLLDRLPCPDLPYALQAPFLPRPARMARFGCGPGRA